MIFFGVAGCSDRGGDSVHLIVPAGFEGVIRIVVDGTDSGGYKHTAGRHAYTIPAGGVLHVKSGKPFEQWHKLSAADANGKTIYWHEPAVPNAQAFIVRGFGVSVTNQGPPIHWYAVGSPEFVARVQKWSYDRSGPPPVAATRPAT
jgi:hypothetical protein